MTIADFVILTVLAVLVVALVYEWNNKDPLPRIDARVWHARLGDTAFIYRMLDTGFITIESHTRFCKEWREGDVLMLDNPTNGVSSKYHIMGISRSEPVHLIDLGPVFQ